MRFLPIWSLFALFALACGVLWMCRGGSSGGAPPGAGVFYAVLLMGSFIVISLVLLAAPLAASFAVGWGAKGWWYAFVLTLLWSWLFAIPLKLVGGRDHEILLLTAILSLVVGCILLWFGPLSLWLKLLGPLAILVWVMIPAILLK
jgi:hypothetical protein